MQFALANTRLLACHFLAHAIMYHPHNFAAKEADFLIIALNENNQMMALA